MSMYSDYTVNDAYHDGFENGLVYILRYLKEAGIDKIAELSDVDLACHLETRKPWKTAEDWWKLIVAR